MWSHGKITLVTWNKEMTQATWNGDMAQQATWNEENGERKKFLEYKEKKTELNDERFVLAPMDGATVILAPMDHNGCPYLAPTKNDKIILAPTKSNGIIPAATVKHFVLGITVGKFGVAQWQQHQVGTWKTWKYRHKFSIDVASLVKAFSDVKNANISVSVLCIPWVNDVILNIVDFRLASFLAALLKLDLWATDTGNPTMVAINKSNYVNSDQLFKGIGNAIVMGSLLIDITHARPMMLYWSNDAYGLYHVLSEISSQYTSPLFGLPGNRLTHTSEG